MNSTLVSRPQDAPRDLHAREYALRVCSDLMWPNVPSNSNLVIEAITAISQGKLCRDRPHPYFAAYVWLSRQIEWAQKQGIVIDGFFFRDGGYTRVPAFKDVEKLPQFAPCGKCNWGWVYQMRDGKSTGRVVACDCRAKWVEENRK